MQLQSKIPVKKTKIIACICLIVLIVVCSVLSNKEISKHKNDSSQNVSDDINIQKKTTIETSELQEKKSDIFVPSTDDKTVDVSSDNNIVSQYAVLVNADDGTITASKNANEKMYPASMTKLMSLLVAVENIKDFNDTYTITYELIAPLIEQEAARAGFESGETVSITDLLYGMALPSGADATMAIVDYVSGNEETFVALMNQKAKALGMNHTHFTNAVGLHDENHYSTALDIAILMKAAMENPTCRQILGSVEYRTTSTQQHPNGMILLSTMYKRMYGNEVKNMTIIGGKTGFTDQAMQCLASYATAVDGNEYVVVTAYAPTEMNPVFDSFAMYGLVNGGYEMPTHLEKTTYPPTEATTTDSSDDSDSTETASDAETELDSSSEDLYGNGDTEATDPEESSSELYE